MQLYYYNAAPQLCRIEDRLDYDALRARDLRRRRIRELRRNPDSPGPGPEETEAAALREAVRQALFALRLLH